MQACAVVLIMVRRRNPTRTVVVRDLRNRLCCQRRHFWLFGHMIDDDDDDDAGNVTRNNLGTHTGHGCIAKLIGCVCVLLCWFKIQHVITRHAHKSIETENQPHDSWMRDARRCSTFREEGTSFDVWYGLSRYRSSRHRKGQRQFRSLRLNKVLAIVPLLC